MVKILKNLRINLVRLRNLSIEKTGNIRNSPVLKKTHRLLYSDTECMSNFLMNKGKSSGILISFIYLPNNTDIKSTVTLVSNGSGLLLCIFSCFLLG